MIEKRVLQQTFLRTLIAAVIASALVGIYAFLFGDFGRTETRILMTTLSVSYFSVTSLAAAAALEGKKGSILGAAGLATSLLGLLAFLPGIWAEWWDSEPYAKSMAVLAIFAFSLAQACLLSLVPLERSIRWVYFATIAALFALATLLSGMLVFESDEEWLVRIAGVLGILDGCGSLSIPVLYKLKGKPVEVADRGSFDRIELVCPRCGVRDTYSVGAVQCVACSLEMKIEISDQPGNRPPAAH